ncbi:hypothetical protein GCK32_018282 [Trichostrongylus colubriformis]|uniref:Uncharacterized protein n=1 Tax=Trichostrongylus colubriformis TaxID=6319 RepID=A0AAN8J2V5_TRICO
MNKFSLVLLVVLSLFITYASSDSEAKAKEEKTPAKVKYFPNSPWIGKWWKTAKMQSDDVFKALPDMKKSFEAIYDDKKLSKKERSKKLWELWFKNPAAYATLMLTYREGPYTPGYTYFPLSHRRYHRRG